MKKAIMVLAAVAMSASAFAQGTIVFANRNILSSTGSGTYNVPIWQNNGGAQGTVGAGVLPGGVTVGLFNGAGTLLGSTLLRTDANSQFFATGSQTLSVTGSNPGDTPVLTVRAWTTSNGSFAAAHDAPGASWGEWNFTTKPLGGTPASGGLPITPPGMTGWGTENGAGLTLTLNPQVPEPTTVALGVLGVGALVLGRRRK